MPQIVPAGQLNVAALSADDLYIQIVNPPSFIRGVPTDVFGTVGTASWGKVNTPIHMGSGQDAAQAFGPIGAPALTDPYDIATDLAIAFSQASSQSSIEGWGVRVTDGTDTAATGTLLGAVTNTNVTATVGGTITATDVCSLIFTGGVVGTPVTVSYTVKSSDTTTTIAAALAAAINANANLQASYVSATSTGAVVTIYEPSSLTTVVTRSVTGGSPTETITLGTSAATGNGVLLTALCTGILGNQISAIISTGAATNTYTVSILPFYGVAEVFPNIPLAGFWSALQNAINNGISGVRGPSNFVTASKAIPAVAAPTTGTYALSGGTDGRAGVVTGTLLGSDTAMPRTGLYALRQLNPAVGVVWIVGTTDTTLPASLVAFAQSEGCSALFPFPTGTSTSSAVSSVATIGQHDPSFAYVKDWIYFFDPINNTTRLLPPTSFIAGTVCTLTPEQSPGNKPVALVVGTERNNPTTGNQPYTPSEIGQLENAGIMLVTNPIPAGSEFGIRHGQTTSLSPATSPFEYWRMTSYLARSFATTMGAFVDQLQSQQPNDPLRQAVKLQLNTFLNLLQGLGQIDSFVVACDFSNSPSAKPGFNMNTPASIGQHFLFVLVKVTYLSSARFFVVSLQGGTTVVTVSANPPPV